MLFVLSLLAAFACAICYGISSVLQKKGSDTQKRATTLNPGLVVRLLGNTPYILGFTLDLMAWPLTIFAVHYLPLFVVQPIIALSVLVTVLVEKVYLHRTLQKQTSLAIVFVLIGLLLIGLQAGVETSRPLSTSGTIVVTVIGPLLILGIGALCARISTRAANLGLAACAGSAFGLDAVTGRVLTVSHPWWHSLYQPALIAMLAYGGIAILLFTIALQRSAASTVNAAVVGIETLLPTVIGIWLLGDTPRNNAYWLLFIGAVLMIGGTIAVALVQPRSAHTG